MRNSTHQHGLLSLVEIINHQRYSRANNPQTTSWYIVKIVRVKPLNLLIRELHVVSGVLTTVTISSDSTVWYTAHRDHRACLSCSALLFAAGPVRQLSSFERAW